MVGVNQVIMLSLNMVIIASMIGAGGLGFDVLSALRRLDIGAGMEAGFAIVALAIALDRLSQAFAEPHQPTHPQEAPLGICAIPTRSPPSSSWRSSAIAGLAIPAVQTYPAATSSRPGRFLVECRALDQHQLSSTRWRRLKNAVLLNILIPFKRFLARPALARRGGAARARGACAWAGCGWLCWSVFSPS
jgi:glycine betaine/proline transport system permease protein